MFVFFPPYYLAHLVDSNKFSKFCFIFVLFFYLQTFYRKCAHLENFNIAIKFEHLFSIWDYFDTIKNRFREKNNFWEIFIIFTSRLLVSEWFTPFCHNFSFLFLFFRDLLYFTFFSFLSFFFSFFSFCLPVLYFFCPFVSTSVYFF